MWVKSLETTNSGMKKILFLNRMLYFISFKTPNFKNDEYDMSVMSIIFMTLQDLPLYLSKAKYSSGQVN